MAADVLKTPNCPENCYLARQESVCKTGPFRATQIWNDIIEHLKANVEVKRRKLLMKSYDHCFTGNAAVDVVFNQLITDKTNFPTREITRDKAVKLCQYMLEQQVFESVKSSKSDDGQCHFEDSPSKLYRFSDKENELGIQHCASCQELSKPDDEIMYPPSDSKDYADYPPSSAKSNRSNTSTSSLFHRHTGVVQELLELTGTWHRRNSECMKRKLTPARLFPMGQGSGRMSFPGPGSMSGGSIGDADEMDSLENLTPEVEEELMKEVSLSQLLTLLDIPVLDNILSYEASVSKSSTKQKAYSNMGFKRSESALSIFSACSDKDDPWWDSGLACVQYLPQGAEMLDSSLTEDTSLTQKLRLYDSIKHHYTDLNAPLWSEKFIDVHLGLLNLLMQSKRDLVLKGLQLSMVLLPSDLKDELKRLLRFLKEAVSEDAIKLSCEENNRTAIERVFSPVLIKNKTLAPHQAGQLAMCMVDYSDQLWDVPGEVDEAVHKQLLDLQEGHKQIPAAKTYCHQVTSAEFRKQQQECTERALVDLMNTILDDTKLTLKDKKQRLKHLQKHHPKIYYNHFENML